MSSIREITTPSPHVISATSPVSEAARMMRDSDIGILPVSEGGRLVGVVTDRDLVIGPVADGNLTGSIGEFMTTNIVTAGPDDEPGQAERLMAENGVRRLVVCDEGSPVGIVSIGDLAVRLSDMAAGEVLHETGPAPRDGVVMEEQMAGQASAFDGGSWN